MTARRVLIVDDEPKMQRILEIMLTQMGHIPVLASNGREALDQLQTSSIDLILSDLKMPVMDGLELLKQLRGQGNDIPFIVITAYATVDSAVAAMKFGASDYIIRPFDVHAVEMAIARALAISHIRQENAFLRDEANKGFAEFIGQSLSMQRIYESIQQVAESRTNVMVVGETGTGKELVARAIHEASPRRNGLFVPVNCAAIPADLLESEMFGFSKGAFTGALKDKPGKFELAEGGTIFLDEITEMSPALQAKLLRVLQENVYERLGSNDPREMDVRIIAATNRDPLEAVTQQKLREDLYYRLQVFSIKLPPLRERPEDIPLLTRHFVQKLAAKLGITTPMNLEIGLVEQLQNYHWPGNVREMENVIERALVLGRNQGLLGIKHLPLEIINPQPKSSAEIQGLRPDSEGEQNLAIEPAVEKLERRFIETALLRSGGNKSKASRILEISERTLWYKLKKYGIQ